MAADGDVRMRVEVAGEALVYVAGRKMTIGCFSEVGAGGGCSWRSVLGFWAERDGGLRGAECRGREHGGRLKGMVRWGGFSVALDAFYGLTDLWMGRGGGVVLGDWLAGFCGDIFYCFTLKRGGETG